MIKAVIFDCFGVLYVDASKYFFEHHIADFEQLRPQIEELFRACDRGFISQTELNQQVAVLTGLTLEFVTEHIQGVHQRNDALLAYAQSLRSDYKVGMLSNIGKGSMDSFFQAHERESLFDAVVLSGEEGMIKPDVAIFELMASRLGVEPSECIMIDDLGYNVQGARDAGMHGVLHVTNDSTFQQVATIIETARA